MTRLEHLNWCKERAIAELNHYPNDRDAIRNCLASMASDLRKHEENNSEALISMCIMMIPQIHSRATARKFIEGFN